MMKQPRGEHDIGSVAHVLTQLGSAQLSFEQADVRKSASRNASLRALKLHRRTVNRNDLFERGSQHLEQRPIAGARVDGQAAIGKEMRNRGEVRGDGIRLFCAFTIAFSLAITRSLREEFSRHLVAIAQNIPDALKTPVAFAKRTPALQRIGHDWISIGRFGDPHKTARPLAAKHDKPRLPKQRQVPRHIWLALGQKHRELTDCKFLFGRQCEQTKPHRLCQNAVELPTGWWGNGVFHVLKLYTRMRMDATSMSCPKRTRPES